MVDSLDQFIENQELVIGNSDIVLLYTDGVTEAWKKESIPEKRDVSQMYDIMHLKKILQQYGSSDVESIRDAILDSLNDYVCYDDVTVMIIKRK